MPLSHPPILNIKPPAITQENYPPSMQITGNTFFFPSSDDWRPMSSAPKDGTVIEIKDQYGVAPWYGLFKWSDTTLAYASRCDMDSTDHIHCKDLGIKLVKTTPGWHQVDQPGGVDCGDWCTWRPYSGDPNHYVDPTGGAQKSMNYWWSAIGLPPEGK